MNFIISFYFKPYTFSALTNNTTGVVLLSFNNNNVHLDYTLPIDNSPNYINATFKLISGATTNNYVVKPFGLENRWLNLALVYNAGIFYFYVDYYTITPTFAMAGFIITDYSISKYFFKIIDLHNIRNYYHAQKTATFDLRQMVNKMDYYKPYIAYNQVAFLSVIPTIFKLGTTEILPSLIRNSAFYSQEISGIENKLVSGAINYSFFVEKEYTESNIHDHILTRYTIGTQGGNDLMINGLTSAAPFYFTMEVWLRFLSTIPVVVIPSNTLVNILGFNPSFSGFSLIVDTTKNKFYSIGCNYNNNTDKLFSSFSLNYNTWLHYSCVFSANFKISTNNNVESKTSTATFTNIADTFTSLSYDTTLHWVYYNLRLWNIEMKDDYIQSLRNFSNAKANELYDKTILSITVGNHLKNFADDGVKIGDSYFPVECRVNEVFNGLYCESKFIKIS